MCIPSDDGHAELTSMQNTQQESLRKEMKDADSKARDGEKTLKSRTSDIEASLSRRDDQVHSLELEISKLRQERENHEASVKEESAKYRQLEQEKEELTKRLSNDDASDDLKKKLESALNLQASADEKVQTLEVQLSEANATADTLRDQIAKLETKHSSSTGEHQTRTRELQTKTNALQTENDSLLSQLAELRTHLISIQDEKFALAETIERLQKELKESKTNKGGYRSSIDSSRTRVSRDFDRSVSLQEIPLEDNTTSRHPQKIPLELKSNIQIDLTSWYDKHAGEVIEV